MPKINSMSIESEILQAYEELRFERRYPKLHTAAMMIRLLAYCGLIPVFIAPEESRPKFLVVWLVVVGFAVIMELTLMIFWQPPGRRFKALMLIVGTLSFGVLMLAVLYYWALHRVT